MYVFTKNVAGDAADVTNIVPPNVGVHEYQFKPSDVKNVAEADVVVKNGLGAEKWLDSLLRSASRPGQVVIDSSRGISVLKPGDKIPLHIQSGSQFQKDVEAGTGGVDVHIWLDPVRVIQQVKNIRDGLAAKDPKNKTVYYKNASAYIARLEAFDRETRQRVKGFTSKDFIAFHSAFIYFSDRYGLNQLAAIEDFPGKEPDPQHLAGITRQVEKHRLKALYTEPQFSPRIVDSLSHDLGVKVLVLDPIETGRLEPDYWEKVMRENVNALAYSLE